MTMRNLFVTAKGGENTIHPWELNTPKDIRAGAVAEMTTRLSQNVSAIKRGQILRFQMKYKSRHQGGSISLPKTSIKFKGGKVSIFQKTLGAVRLGKRHKKKPKYSDTVECDSRMIYDGRSFYLLLPKKVKVKEQEDKKATVALDPGVRTFQTGFSETEFFKAHIDDTKFEKLKKKIRLLQSLWDTKKIRNPRKKIMVLWKKIKNLVDECHWKTIRHLLNKYSDVLLPSFESQEMVKGTTLHKKTKGDMLVLSHFKFKVRLKEKAYEYKNFRIHDVNESYTSKTCSCCGCMNDVGSKKKFVCSHCGTSHDRDVNAARNIFIKYSV
jgi:putative transposase